MCVCVGLRVSVVLENEHNNTPIVVHNKSLMMLTKTEHEVTFVPGACSPVPGQWGREVGVGGNSLVSYLTTPL